MNPNQPTIQCCSINGKVCRNGKREDFPIDDRTGEKFVCNEWVNLKGKNPQSGEVLDQWMCGKWATTVILLEIAQQTKQAGASTDKVANEIRRGQSIVLGLAGEQDRGRLLQADVVNQNGIEHKGA